MKTIVAKISSFLISLLFATAVVAAEQAPKNVVELASGADQLSTLLSAISAADLTEALADDGPYTVFAPTNDAFASLPPGALESLLQNKAALIEVLTYHVVPGKILSSDIKDGKVATVSGQNIELDVSQNGVKVNNANVVQADIIAKNGVVHIIDAVLIPQNMEATTTTVQ